MKTEPFSFEQEIKFCFIKGNFIAGLSNVGGRDFMFKWIYDVLIV